MTKETAKAIKQLIPNQDKALMMCSSINNAIALLKLYKLSNQEIKTIITAMVIGQEEITCQQLTRELVRLKNFSTFEHYMDDELRERVAWELAPCSDEDFMDHYVYLHYETFVEEFEIN